MVSLRHELSGGRVGSGVHVAEAVATIAIDRGTLGCYESVFSYDLSSLEGSGAGHCSLQTIEE